MALEIADAPSSSFIWGSGGAQLTPEQIAARRKAADALIATGTDATPIRSGWQGVARVAQALSGALDSRDADRAERANAEANKAMIASLITGGGSPAVSATPAIVAPAATVPAAADTSGKIYRNDEPSPLDPPSGADRDALIRTVYGEAANEPALGQQAVASVIRNRAVDGSYGGDTPLAVVKAPGQFEPWAGGPARDRMLALSPDDPKYAAIAKVVDAAYGSGGRAPDDPTEGKTMFYSPSAQAALGRPAPSWAKGEGQVIGGHTFYDDTDGAAAVAKPVQVASADPAAIPVNAQLTEGTLPSAPAAPVAKVAGALNGINPAVLAAMTSPYASDSTKKIAGLLLQAQLTQEKPTPLSVGKDSTVIDPKTGRVIYKATDNEEDKPKWGIVGKDQYGQPTYGYPPTRAEAAAAKAAAPTAKASDVPDDLTGVHGKEYIAALEQTNKPLASQVQAIIEGRAPYPTGMLLKTPYGQALAQHVTQADPSFETGNAMARVKVRNEFKSGGVSSPAGQITAGNTALQHAGEMSDALERMKDQPGLLAAVGSSGIPFVSYAANQLKNKSLQGTPEGAALADFNTAKNHFSEEVTKFYAGSGGSEAERARALANLDAAKSLDELRSAIKTEANLMHGKVNAMQERWRTGMGPLVGDFPLIHPESQKAVERIMQRAGTNPTASGTVPASIDPAALEEARRRGLIK